MPYKSDAQRKFFNANRAKLEAQGVDVDEWNESSKGKKLPKKVKEAQMHPIQRLAQAAAQKQAFVMSEVDFANKFADKATQLGNKLIQGSKAKELGNSVLNQEVPKIVPLTKNMLQGLDYAETGRRVGAGTLGGAAFGGLKGLLEEPGYNLKTGKKKSRILHVLKNLLGGAAVGGTASYLIPKGENIGASIGYGIGSGSMFKRSTEMCSCGCGKAEGECDCDKSDVQKMAQFAAKQARCWKGYEPVPGKAPYSEDSCRPKGSGKKKKNEKKAELLELVKQAVSQKKASEAWQKSEGQNSEGGLNEKGRKSYEAAHGGDLKPPVTESNPKGERAGRKASFCARMGGMKSKLTSKETANDPDSRINKALRKWNC